VRPLGAKRVIEVNVRVIASTVHDLESMVRRGRFRRDLFFRLKGMQLEIPPLRERWEDIPGLAERILAQGSSPGPGLEAEALDRLLRYPWPGNVRELENEMHRLVALGLRPVKLESLSPWIRDGRGRGIASPGPEDVALAQVVISAEREAVLAALQRSGGNKSRAAQQLGITRKALYRRLAKYRLNRPEAAPGQPPSSGALGVAEEVGE
jgi:two-component system response regulator HydG